MAQQASKKVRVFELAKTLGLDTKAVLDYCRDLGYDVKNQLSSLETDQADALKIRINKGGKPAPAAPAPAVARPAALPKGEKRIATLPAPVAKKVEVAPEPVYEEPVEFEPEPEPEPVHEPEPVVVRPPVVDVPSKVPNLTAPRPAPAARVVEVREPEPEPAPEPQPVAEVAPPPVVEVRPAPVEVAPPVVEPTPTVAAEIKPVVEEAPAPVEAPQPAPAVAEVPEVAAPAVAKPVPVPAKVPSLQPARPSAVLGSRVNNLSGPPRQMTSPRPAAPAGATPRPAAPAAGAGAPPRPATAPAGTGGVPTRPTTPAGPAASATGGPAAPRPMAPRPGGPGSPTPGGPAGARPPMGQGGPPRQLGTGGASRPMPGTGGMQRPPVLTPRPPQGPGGPPQGQGGPRGPMQQQRGGPAGAAPPGAAGQQGGERRARPMNQRGIGQVARPGGMPAGPGGPAGPRGPAGPGQAGAGAANPAQPRRFTLEELKALREGKSLHEVKRQFEQPVLPAKPVEDDEEEARGKKGPGGQAKPGPGGEKDRRAVERKNRTDARKAVKAKDIVLEGGHAEVADEQQFGSRRGPRAALLKKQRRQVRGTVERKGKVPISLPITVRSLSEAIGTKAAALLLKLKELTNALFTINSNVEVDVAELIAEEKGVELEILKTQDVEDVLLDEHKEAAEDESKLESRAPIVTIMGHVDHGKTTLLDTIRKKYGVESDVVSTEAGGITQVIRAWRVERDGKPVTFLDTPGHEAFTKMRARGANVTDVAVIVVAADSGVQPQTEEAVAHAKAAGVSIVVAINKSDMPGADPTRVERQMYNLGLLPDTMGGDVQFVRTSAVKGTGIDELLDTLALVAEVRELKANPHKPAQGTCLEAYLSGDEGVMATMIVQQGTLNRGDIIICGGCYGRVRAMYDDLGRSIKTAGPSMPVRITGLNEVPNADDHFHVVAELVKAREIAEKRRERMQESNLVRFTPVTLDKLGAAKATKIAELKVILKAEARGSVEAIRKELEKLVHDEVRVRVLHSGIGAITESDVQLALASPDDSIIVGFNVVPDDAALKLAEERDIPIREYNIIYKLTEDIKRALEGKLKPEERVIHLGRAVVRQTFKISKVGTAAGCYVTQGNIERSAKIRVIRDGAVIYPQGEKIASLDSLKRFKDDVREVKEGYDCGMKVAGYDDIKVGDVIEAYRIEQVQRTL